jgi:hypothetical protein
MQSLALVAHNARKRGDADTLLRLRTALRRTVESMYVLVVPRAGSRLRLCAVQCWFYGGKHRDFLILHKAGTGGSVGARPASWWARSLASVTDPAELDLRRREDALALEEELMEMDMADLERGE